MLTEEAAQPSPDAGAVAISAVVTRHHPSPAHERPPAFGEQVAVDEDGFPLGVSWTWIQRFFPKAGEPPEDDRVGRPVVGVAARRPVHAAAFAEAGVDPSRVGGLGDVDAWTAALRARPARALEALARAIDLFPQPDGDARGDAAAWARALARPVATTADVCFTILKPDCRDAALAAAVAAAPATAVVVAAPAPAAPPPLATRSYAALCRADGVTYHRASDARDYWDRRLDDGGEPFVGRATHFVSHAWSYPFATLAGGIKAFWEARDREASPRPYFWLDIACIDQHRTADLPTAFWEGTFTAMIRAIGATVLCLSPWGSPVAVTRIWCLWEIYSTIVSDLELVVAMPEEEEEAFGAALQRDVEAAIELMSRVDASSAQATSPVDRDRIRAVIAATIGFNALNDRVRGAMHGYLLAHVARLGDAPAAARLVAQTPAALRFTVVVRGSARRAAALTHAALGGHTELVGALVAAGADIEAADTQRGLTALHLAALADRLEVVRFLVEHAGADVARRERFGEQDALALACTAGAHRVVAYLAALKPPAPPPPLPPPPPPVTATMASTVAGGAPGAPSDDSAAGGGRGDDSPGAAAAAAASVPGRLGGAALRARPDAFGVTPLARARGPIVYLQNEVGPDHWPGEAAVLDGKARAAALLEALGAPAETRASALAVACIAADVKAARAVLDAERDAHSGDGDGGAAAVAVLANFEAEPTVVTRGRTASFTPLGHVVQGRERHADNEELGDCGDDDERARVALVALLLARVALLLARGAAPEAVTQRPTPGRLLPAAVAPLQLAAHHGHTAIARALLDGGARVDFARGGLTPLMLGARSLRAATVELLLARGADAARVAARDAYSDCCAHGVGHKQGQRAAALAAHGAQFCRPGGAAWAQYARVVARLTAAGGGDGAVSAAIRREEEDAARRAAAGGDEGSGGGGGNGDGAAQEELLASGAAQSDGALLANLAAMGFVEDDARAALDASGGDFNQALDALFAGMG